MYFKIRYKPILYAPITICLLLSLFCSSLFADVVVIVHPDNQVNTLTKTEVKKLFLGKTRSFPDGTKVKPVELSEGPVRIEFIKNVLRKNESSLSSYWARMKFSNKANQPRQYTTEDKIKQVVASNRNAIGYIDRSLSDDSVKIISFN